MTRLAPFLLLASCATLPAPAVYSDGAGVRLAAETATYGSRVAAIYRNTSRAAQIVAALCGVSQGIGAGLSSDPDVQAGLAVGSTACAALLAGSFLFDALNDGEERAASLAAAARNAQAFAPGERPGAEWDAAVWSIVQEAIGLYEGGKDASE